MLKRTYRSYCHRVTKAFSLIELLVVLGIIVALVAMLLPAIAEAREASRRTVCGANLRANGLLIRRFAQDNNRVPYGCNGYGHWGSQQGLYGINMMDYFVWQDAYNFTGKSFVCPEYPFNFTDGNSIDPNGALAFEGSNTPFGPNLGVSENVARGYLNLPPYGSHTAQSNAGGTQWGWLYVTTTYQYFGNSHYAYGDYRYNAPQWGASYSYPGLPGGPIPPCGTNVPQYESPFEVNRLEEASSWGNKLNFSSTSGDFPTGWFTDAYVNLDPEDLSNAPLMADGTSVWRMKTNPSTIDGGVATSSVTTAPPIMLHPLSSNKATNLPFWQAYCNTLRTDGSVSGKVVNFDKQLPFYMDGGTSWGGWNCCYYR